MSSINHVPVIYANDTTIKLGDAFNPLSIVTAYDEEDKDLTQSVEVVKNNVDTKKEGNYTVTYRVKDKNGATATKTITVTVVKGVTLASEIKISNKFNNLYLGASKEINAAVNKEADIKDIKWSVSDTNILNKNGIKSVNLGIGMKKSTYIRRIYSYRRFNKLCSDGRRNNKRSIIYISTSINRI